MLIAQWFAAADIIIWALCVNSRLD